VHLLSERILSRKFPSFAEEAAKDRHEKTSRLLLSTVPWAMFGMGVAFLSDVKLWQVPEHRWMVATGPASLGEQIPPVLVGMNLYELVLYATYGKRLEFWIHHLVAIGASAWQATSRQAVVWATFPVFLEGTTPLLTLLKTMHEAGYTYEPTYKMIAGFFWLAWVSLRLLMPPAVMAFVARDYLMGHVPPTQSRPLLLCSFLMYATVFGLSVAWSRKLATRIFPVLRGCMPDRRDSADDKKHH